MIDRPRPSLRVEAPARLHLGFLDLNGGLGRRFGSLGLTIDTFATRLTAQLADDHAAAGPGAGRALACARAYAAARGLRGGVQIRLAEEIPGHAGLGSGTQMALAVGTALERLLGPGAAGGVEQWNSRAIARVLGRGRRSGIGIGAFDEGGFIVDCGRGDQPGVPPVALRLPFPADWRVLLVLDRRGQGLHGDREADAFAALPALPAATAGHLCRLLLMQLVPGLIEGQLPPVADAIGQIQRAVGAHFAPAQGGLFASPAVAAVLDWAAGQGFPGSGQSSWGPTGFILVEDAERAGRLERAIKARFGDLAPLDLRIAAGRNRGAVVEPVQTARQPVLRGRCAGEGRGRPVCGTRDLSEAPRD